MEFELNNKHLFIYLFLIINSNFYKFRKFYKN